MRCPGLERRRHALATSASHGIVEKLVQLLERLDEPVREATTSRADVRATLVTLLPEVVSVSTRVSIDVCPRPCSSIYARQFRQQAPAELADLHAATFGLAASPAGSEAWTSLFILVRVMRNVSAIFVIEASVRPGCSKTPRRVATDSARTRRQCELPILNHTA